MRISIVLVGALLFFGGCGSLWSSRDARTPLVPTAKQSDLVIVRTGDRAHYYVIDKKRKLCFFHATMYGKKHLEEIDCSKLREARDYLDSAPAAPRRVLVPKATPPPTATPKRPPVYEPGTTLTDEDRNGFRRAWVQHYCGRRNGTEEPLTVVLSRHGLTREAWDAAKAEFSADKDLWGALTGEALSTCP